jgi:hypothetical protein
MRSAMQGGDFFEGMVSSAAAAGFSKYINDNFETVGGRTTAAAIIGGTAAVIGGGKFANGATSAVFMWLFNEEQHRSLRFEDGKLTFKFSDFKYVQNEDGSYSLDVDLKVYEMHIDSDGNQSISILDRFNYVLNKGEYARFELDAGIDMKLQFNDMNNATFTASKDFEILGYKFNYDIINENFNPNLYYHAKEHGGVGLIFKRYNCRIETAVGRPC